MPLALHQSPGDISDPWAMMFSDLPPELLLLIIDHLPPDAIIRLALAAYPLLRHHNIIPRIPFPAARRLFLGQTDPNPCFTSWRLPTELTLAILRNLDHEELIWFVVEHYQLMVQAGIAPELKAVELGRSLYLSCAMEARRPP